MAVAVSTRSPTLTVDMDLVSPDSIRTVSEPAKQSASFAACSGDFVGPMVGFAVGTAVGVAVGAAVSSNSVNASVKN